MKSTRDFLDVIVFPGLQGTDVRYLEIYGDDVDLILNIWSRSDDCYFLVWRYRLIG